MRIVIIGSGLAGQLVLRNLRDGGFLGEVTIISKSSGHFYTKPSLSNVFTQKKKPSDLIVSSQDEVEKDMNCKILIEEVLEIDRENQTVKTKQASYAYDRLILAMGADLMDLPILPTGGNVLRVNHLDDYQHFFECVKPDREIIIVGGGLIGVEFAADIANHARKVTLIERMPSLMGAMVPKEIGDYIKKGLEALGVEVHLNQDILSIEDSKQVTVNLKDQSLVGDTLLAAVGLQPEISLAEKADLRIERGIYVNQYGQSSDPNIYALGDCANVCGITRSFVSSLRICAQSIADHIMEKDNPIVYPPLPVLLKTPTIPVGFCYKNPPKHWQVSSDSEGIEALAYEGEQLTGFALAGNKLERRNSLKAQLLPWLSKDA